MSGSSNRPGRTTGIGPVDRVVGLARRPIAAPVRRPPVRSRRRSRCGTARSGAAPLGGRVRGAAAARRAGAARRRGRGRRGRDAGLPVGPQAGDGRASGARARAATESAAGRRRGSRAGRGAAARRRGRSCAVRSRPAPVGGGRLGPALPDAGLLGVVPGAAAGRAGGRLDAGLAQDLGERAPARVGVPVRFGHHAPPNESSLRRMTPSRSAHGQIRTHGTSSARIVAAATTAPAGTWCARSGDTPRSSASAADSIRDTKPTSWSRPIERQLPRHPQPGRVGRGAGEPGQRAEGLARGGHQVGPAGVAQLLRRRLQQVRARARRAPRGRRGRAGRRPAPPGRNRRVIRPAPERQRQRDVGVLVDAAGQLQRAAADVEDQQPAGAPAEPPADGEEGQPGLVLPGEHLQVDAGALPDAVEHLQAVLAPRGSPR